MILSTPLFSIIKKQLPDSEITVLASVHNHIVIRNNPNVDSILIFDKSPLKLTALYSKLRKVHFDYLIDPKDHYSRESKLIAYVVLAKHKIGFIGDRKKSPFTIGIADSDSNENVHYISRVLNVLTSMSIEISQQIPLPELLTTEESDINIKKFFENVNDKKILLINLSAGSPDRLWPAVKWKSVINSVDRSKVYFVLIYMNTEQKLAEEIINATNIVSFNSDKFDDIISIISKSHLLISPDTSLIHVASAFNKPILALYNGLHSNYMKFAPLSSLKDIVFAADGQKSIEEIDTHIVIDKLSDLLNRI